MTTKDVLALALEALESSHEWLQNYDYSGDYPETELCQRNIDAITAIKQAQQAQAEVMVDMTPPATARDKWMYEQGRLAERDPRTHVIEQAQDEGVCKGAWVLGTACGTCSKCIATKPQAPKQAITPETGNSSTLEASAITSGNGQAQEPVACGCCNGTGWVVRDPDIGTDQECFCCNGSGKAETESAPKQAQEPVYWECRYKESNQYTVNYGQWYPWERLTPRNGLETVENRVAEIQHYIDRGYSYELRALFTHPAPKQAEPAITAHEQRCADVATAMFRNREGIQEIKAAITEPVVKESLTVPAGYKLVPVEPTQEMLDAVVTTVDDHLLGPDAEKQYREDWAAMLAAAPTPPETK